MGISRHEVVFFRNDFLLIFSKCDLIFDSNRVFPKYLTFIHGSMIIGKTLSNMYYSSVFLAAFDNPTKVKFSILRCELIFFFLMIGNN